VFIKLDSKFKANRQFSIHFFVIQRNLSFNKSYIWSIMHPGFERNSYESLESRILSSICKH